MLRVVIVEDSAIIRERLDELCADIADVQIVAHADTEHDAVALLRLVNWDMLVIDLQLREGTGLGVLKALKAMPDSPERKVVVFTNYAFPQYRDRSFSLGAHFFFDKSLEFNDLRATLVKSAHASTVTQH